MKKKIIILLLIIISIGFVYKVYASVESNIRDWLNDTFTPGIICLEHGVSTSGRGIKEMERIQIQFDTNGDKRGYFSVQTYNVEDKKWTKKWNEQNGDLDDVPGLGYTAYLLQDRYVEGNLNEIPGTSKYFSNAFINDKGQFKHRDPRQWIVWYSARAKGLNGYVFKFIQSRSTVNSLVDGNRWNYKDDYLKSTTDSLIRGWDSECEDYNWFVTHYEAPEIKESSIDPTNVEKDSTKNQLGPFKATWYVNEKGKKSFGNLTLQVIRKNGNALGESAWYIIQDGKKVSLSNLEQGKNFYIMVDSKYVNNSDTGIVGGKVELKYTRKIYTGTISRWDPHSADQRVMDIVAGKPIDDDDVVSWKIPPEEKTNQITIVKKDADTEKELIGTDLSFSLVKVEGDKYMSCKVDIIDKSTAKLNELQDEPAGIRYTEVKGGFTITGLSNGKYLLYEKCPEGADKDTWIADMKERYKQEKFPKTLPGNQDYYFCKEINLNNSKEETRIRTYTIFNKSTPSPQKLTLQKQDELGNPLKNVDVTFALVKVGDPLYYYSVDEMGKAKKSSTPTTFTFQEEITIYDLEAGKYKLYETEAPEGYDPKIWSDAMKNKYPEKSDKLKVDSGWVYCADIEIKDQDNDLEPIQIKNFGENKNLTLNKVDTLQNPLEGVEVTFALVKVGNPLYYYSVDENGNAQKSETPTTFSFEEQIKIYNLESGHYKLYETEPPTGCDYETWSEALKAKYHENTAYKVNLASECSDWIYCADIDFNDNEGTSVTIENQRRKSINDTKS